MSSTERNMWAVFGIVAAVMVFFLLLSGIVYLANGIEGLRALLTASGYIAALIIIVILVSGIQIVGAWISNLNSRNFIAAQQSNDDSDVAKFNALKESLRGDREYQKDVRRQALPMAKMLAKPTETEPAMANTWYTDDDDEDVDADYQVLE